MNDINSTTPIMGGSFTLAFRPAKRARSPSSQDTSPDPKRVCKPLISSNDHLVLNTSPTPNPQTKPTITTTTSPTSTAPSKFDIPTLKFPAMLLKKAKRRGLPIHSQFIHPGFFIRHLDKQHPEIDFTIADYKEAWQYAVVLASKNVDLSHLVFAHPRVARRRVEEEMGAACCLVDKVRLRTRDEYAASKQAASVRWANADSQRFHELLEEKRERKRQWREEKEKEMQMELVLDDVEIESGYDSEGSQVRMFDFVALPFRCR